MRKPGIRWGCWAVLITSLSMENLYAAKPWEILLPFKRIEADPNKQYPLEERHGPWMILASSFAGPGAEEQARSLVLELRKELKLEAFLHKQSYDFTDSVIGVGLNRYGGPKKMRYANASKFDEIGVLVGNFNNIDDPAAEKALQKIKYARPKALNVSEGEVTAQRFVSLRELQRKLTPDSEKKAKGPMGNAFITRNPLLPPEALGTGGVDTFVAKMNADVEFSLLDNPGKYTVRIATFRGASTIDVKEIEKNGRGLESKLEQAAIKANELTMALRRQGVEAYEFHDRYQSYVTVGSFSSLGKPLPNGKMEWSAAIKKAIETYGPREQSLSNAPAGNLVPYSINGIQCDVAPSPIEVPKVSIASAYDVGNKLYQ